MREQLGRFKTKQKNSEVEERRFSRVRERAVFIVADGLGLSENETNDLFAIIIKQDHTAADHYELDRIAARVSGNTYPRRPE